MLLDIVREREKEKRGEEKRGRGMDKWQSTDKAPGKAGQGRCRRRSARYGKAR
jgi:hypothetical protein